MTKTNLACCLLLATLLLSGCANTQPNFSQLLAARTNCVDEFDQYSYINFDEDGQVKAMLGSQESQCGAFSWGATFVLPIVLPASEQDYQLVIDSFVGIDSILSPMALFLNEQYQPVAQVGTEQFGYSNRRYRAVINVNSREREHFRYLLLTTDPKALGKENELVAITQFITPIVVPVGPIMYTFNIASSDSNIGSIANVEGGQVKVKMLTYQPEVVDL